MSQENNEGQAPEPPKQEALKELPSSPDDAEQFKVHNGIRDVFTRTTRAQNPTHRGLKQFLPIRQLRLLRGRPVIVTKRELKEHAEEMRSLEKSGLLYVTTLDGRDVNLETFEAAGPLVDPPLPHPPLDSAANDQPGGQEKMGLPGEVEPPQNFSMPVEPPVTAFDEDNPGAQSFDQAVATSDPLEDPPAPHSDTLPDFAKPQPHHKKKGK